MTEKRPPMLGNKLISAMTDDELLRAIVNQRTELSRLRALNRSNPTDRWTVTQLILRLFSERDKRGLP